MWVYVWWIYLFDLHVLLDLLDSPTPVMNQRGVPGQLKLLGDVSSGLRVVLIFFPLLRIDPTDLPHK